jgi:tetrathionate reductase subunit A
VAYDGSPVADASDKDMLLTGVDRIAPAIKRTLKADEWRKVAYVYARGGRFENGDQSYDGELLSHRYNKPMQIYDENLALARNTLNGERYVGTPTWVEPRLADGSPLAQSFPHQQWPFQVVSTKSNLQSSHSIGVSSLQQIHPSNAIAIHLRDADRLGVHNGDRIRVTTPGGSVEGVALVRAGIQPGVLGIEHGFGHRELGARAHRIGDQLGANNPRAGYGVNINDLGFADPRRVGLSVLTDWVVGNVARQGLPAKVQKV